MSKFLYAVWPSAAWITAVLAYTWLIWLYGPVVFVATLGTAAAILLIVTIVSRITDSYYKRSFKYERKQAVKRRLLFYEGRDAHKRA